jgi:hypothetical protein
MNKYANLLSETANFRQAFSETANIPTSSTWFDHHNQMG